MSETGYLVTYNNQAPWGSGLNSNTPFVSLEVEEVWQAGRLGYIRTVTLNGTVPSGGASQITGIVNCFASNFKPFVAPTISMSGAIVQEVSFAAQNYIGKVDYTVILKDFSGFASNVNEPTDEISFQDQQDGSVIVNHKVGAQGVNISGDSIAAFNSAKNFVLSRTGLSTVNALTTSFVSNVNRSHIYVVSQQESLNRATATYAVAEVFRYDPLRDVSNGTCKRFTAELNSGINDDYISVAVNGIYQVGKDVFDSGIFSQVAISELYSIANSTYGGVLNSLPLSFNLDAESASENMYTRTVNARALFDNSPTVSFFDYDIEAEKDYKNGVTQINVRGIIVGSGRHVRRKYASALSFFNGIGGWSSIKNYIYNIATSGAVALGYSSFNLNTKSKTFSVNFNSGQGSITLNATFDDAPFVINYNDFQWGVSTDCGLNVFKPHASANKNGSYVIQDLNILNRSSVNINGNFDIPATGVFNSIEHLGIRTKLLNLEGVINAFSESDSYNISSGETIKTGFSISYSKEGCGLSNFPVDGKIYNGTNI